MATATDDTTMETSGIVSDDPTMEASDDDVSDPTTEASNVATRSLHKGAASANFSVTGLSGAVENAKVKVSKLYLRQIFGGPGMNQLDVIHHKGLGRTIVNNWAIYDGHGKHANLVANGYGMQTFAGKWNNWFTLEFVVERFKGSTLQVMGANDENERNEWAIVGGTGKFSMARGTIKRSGDYDKNENTLTQELTIKFFCRMKDKEVVVPPSPEIKPPPIQPPQIPTRKKRGPWGGNGGSFKEMEGKSQRLESLTIYHHGVVEGFQFSYVDEDGEIRTSGIWGQNRNLWRADIKFGQSEYVKEISVAGSPGTPSYLCKLQIVTNQTTYGPFGFWNYTPSTYTILEKETVVGFCGSNDTAFVTTIGVYTISK